MVEEASKAARGALGAVPPLPEAPQLQSPVPSPQKVGTAAHDAHPEGGKKKEGTALLRRSFASTQALLTLSTQSVPIEMYR